MYNIQELVQKIRDGDSSSFMSLLKEKENAYIQLLKPKMILKQMI